MIKTVETEITPEQAGAWMITHNERTTSGKFRQRNLSINSIEKYASDMKAGNWVLCPQPIVFDVEDNLLDGQHRLEAIKKANIPIKMMVSTGWPKEATNGSLKLATLDTIDRGRPRSIMNQLQIHGVQNAAATAATVNSFVRVCYGGNNMPISYATTTTLLRGFGVQDHIEGLLKQGSVSAFKGRIFGPLAFYRTVKPRKADEFIRQFLNLDFEKQTGPWILARYMTERHNETATQKAVIRAACACLRIWNTDETVTCIRPTTESCEWLCDMNPKLTESVRKLCGTHWKNSASNPTGKHQ